MAQETPEAAGQGQGRRRAAQAGRDRGGPAADHQPGEDEFLIDTPPGVDTEALDAAIFGSGSLPPPGPELAAKNRRLIAARLGWPDGAVEACEAFDAAHPGWSASWHAGNDVRPAPGYYAVRRKAVHGEPMAYGATVAELGEAVDGWPYRDPWDQPFEPL